MSNEHYDVIIVGGGPVGLAQALSLTRFQHGLRVALLDRRSFTVPDDKRAFALSAGVRRVLDTLGVWDAVAAESEPCLLYTSPSPRDGLLSRMPSSA